MEANFSKRKITPEQAIVFLSKQGINISLDDAESVVDLLYLLAEIFASETAEDENS